MIQMITLIFLLKEKSRYLFCYFIDLSSTALEVFCADYSQFVLYLILKDLNGRFALLTIMKRSSWNRGIQQNALILFV